MGSHLPGTSKDGLSAKSTSLPGRGSCSRSSWLTPALPLGTALTQKGTHSSSSPPLQPCSRENECLNELRSPDQFITLAIRLFGAPVLFKHCVRFNMRSKKPCTSEKYVPYPSKGRKWSWDRDLLVGSRREERLCRTGDKQPNLCQITVIRDKTNNEQSQRRKKKP